LRIRLSCPGCCGEHRFAGVLREAMTSYAAVFGRGRELAASERPSSFRRLAFVYDPFEGAFANSEFAPDQPGDLCRFPPHPKNACRPFQPLNCRATLRSPSDRIIVARAHCLAQSTSPSRTLPRLLVSGMTRIVDKPQKISVKDDEGVAIRVIDVGGRYPILTSA